MEEDLYERIGEGDLNPTYKDGQVYQHTDVNNMLSILKTAINENYYDIQRLENGEKTVGNANSIEGATLSRYLIEELQADDDKIPSSQQVKSYVDSLFEVYSPPIRGVDYWTEEDQEYIIDQAGDEAALKPKGDYDSTIQYKKLDVVLYQGSSYVALQTVQGIVPTNEEYWQKLVSGGVSRDEVPLIFNTVAEMKSAEDLVIGDNVQTLGYYEINDGGGATYKITDEESENDYQEELENGLYASLIVVNNIINYNQFGAKLDGINSDKNAIEKCHEIANKHKYNIIQVGGKAIGDFKVDVKTNCKFNNFTLIRSDDYADRNYKIIPDDYVLSNTVNLNITNGYTGNIGGYTNKSFTLTTENSEWSLGVRNITGGVEGFHTQPVVLDNEGNIISAPIWKACNGTFILNYIQDVNTPRLTFDGLIVEENSLKHGYTIAVECFRNNTTISNITVLSKTTPSSSDYNSFGAIYVHDCINCIIEKINGKNHVDNSSITAYILTVSKSFNVNINNIFGYRGWGIIATHFIDTMNISNCYMNRIDNHYGAFGRFSFRDTTLIGQGAINLGYGNADVYIDNINLISPSTSYQGFVRYREDYYCTFSGNLYISNCDIANKNYIILYSHKPTADGNSSNFDNKSLRYTISNVRYSSGIPRLLLKKVPTNIYAYVINTSFNLSGISAISGGDQRYFYSTISNVNGKNLTAIGSLVSSFSNSEPLTSGTFNSCVLNDYPHIATGKALFNGCDLSISGNTFNPPSGAGTSHLTGCSARNTTTTNNLSVTVTGCYNIT